MKNLQRGFIPILIIILAVVIVSAGLYFSSQEKAQNSPNSLDISLEGTSTSKNSTQVTKTEPKTANTGDVEVETEVKVQPKVSSSTQTEVLILKVVSEGTIGAGQPDEELLAGELKEFKISQKDAFAKEFNINGSKIILKALESHENTDVGFVPYNKEVCSRDRSWCQNLKDWIVISINGTPVKFGREEIKQVIFDNSLKINIMVADIEGVSSNHYGSDGGFVVVK